MDTATAPNRSVDVGQKQTPEVSLGEVGVKEAEAFQFVGGFHGKYFVWVGIALLMIAYELDNSTFYVYSNYAPSEFNALSQKAALDTASTLLFAVVKPPTAKLSNIFGRATTYCWSISFYLLGYILLSASKNFTTYAVGTLFHTIGQTATNMNTDFVLSDISSTRWRTFALSIQFFPFLIMPWVAGNLCAAVLSNIGWRWGIGMLGFILPGLASFLVVVLFVFQRRARRAKLITIKKVTPEEFFSSIDAGGVFLLCAGFVMFFLPINLASTAPSKWNTPWIISVMVIGAVLLVALVPYEKFVAKYPILPVRYFANPTIVLSASTIFIDSMCFSATHTYLYSWVVVTHNYDVEKATYFLYVNGVVQALVGIIAGCIIYRTKHYKWILFGACVVRTVGYGVMVRLRGAENSDAEIFLVQAIQGIGSGVVAIVCVTASQFVVPHVEMAQVTALILLSSFLGSGIGASVAGGIYTNYFEDALRKYMGADTPEATINAIYNSITSSLLPTWGTPERTAANNAYSEVMKWISVAAVCCSAITLFTTFFMPNFQLSDNQNLVEGDQTLAETPKRARMWSLDARKKKQAAVEHDRL